MVDGGRDQRARISLRWSRVYAIAGIVFVGTVAFSLRDVIRERIAVQSLRRLGYDVELSCYPVSEPEPDQFDNIGFLGIHRDGIFDNHAMDRVVRFRKLRCLALYCKSIEPGVLRRLGVFPHLRTLAILGVADADIDDSALVGIGSAASLRMLTIRQTKCQGPVLAEVASMKSLKDLNIDCNSHLWDLGEIQLRHLKKVNYIELGHTAIAGDCLGGIPDCEYLSLYDTSAEDITLRGLSQCVRLKSLILSGTKIAGEGLKYLVALPCLKELTLARCPITDEAMDYVSSLKQLRTLGLDDTPISDDGLARLCEAKQLKYVSLTYCPHISAAGVKRLRQALLDASPANSEAPRVFTGWSDDEAAVNEGQADGIPSYGAKGAREQENGSGNEPAKIDGE